MTSIIFLVGTIEYNQFRCNYVKTKNHFPKFFLHFWNVAQILNILEKKMTLKTYGFPKLRTAKEVLR